MVDYKKYIQVLDILKRKESINSDTEKYATAETYEEKASAICELFDTQKTVIIGNTPTIAPKLYDIKPTYYDNQSGPIFNLNRATYGCTDKTDCEGYN